MPVGSARWQAITYGDGMFVAVAEYTGDTAYSTDGVNWTLVTVPGEPWDGVTYGNGAFVAVSFSDHVSMHSTDAGQTWTEAATPPNEWNAVAYGDGEFVATPYVSQNAAYSTNGVNWSTTVLPGGNDWSSIAYGDGAFAAVASLTSYAAGIEFGAQASSTGNTFVATLGAPINATPTGSVTITDSANGTCTSGNWTDDGPDGNGLGGELYTATCAISSNESAGETMTATYSGADYSTLTSNETGIDDAPAITAATMTGTAGVGDVLTAGSSGVTGYPAPTESYQWLDNGVNVTGATSSTYTVQTSDVGHVIAVAVTETNGLGSAATATSAASATVQGPPHGQPSTTTTTTPPMTTTTTPPTSPTPPQPSVKPGESNLGFSANSATLGAGARTALRALARKLGAGARVTITGYAKGNARLARARAVAAAAYLKRFAHVTVTISARTSSSNKVTVLTTTV
jgi:outer membrane protein OmpA-like peptidoglycan-associated protein